MSVICCLMDPEYLPAVVVCPAHMPEQWRAYLARLAPELRVPVIRKGQPYDLINRRRQQRDMWDDRLPDVIVTNYYKLRGWAETLAGFSRTVIFDECRQLRGAGSLIYAASERLAKACRIRLGLSATPICNYGVEFHNVIDVLVPGALGERDEFIREWCTAEPGDKAKIRDTAAFGAYLRREGIMLRRTRADVGRELPRLSKISHTIEADEKALEQVTGAAMMLVRIILAH